MGLGAFFTGRLEKGAVFSSCVLASAFCADIKGFVGTFALRGESGEGIVGRKALKAVGV